MAALYQPDRRGRLHLVDPTESRIEEFESRAEAEIAYWHRRADVLGTLLVVAVSALALKLIGWW